EDFVKQLYCNLDASELVLQTEFGLAKQAAQNSFSSRLGNKYYLSGR
ncbi:hypothetical protein CEXT_430941, partial [Caerostris extrusa]